MYVLLAIGLDPDDISAIAVSESVDKLKDVFKKDHTYWWANHPSNDPKPPTLIWRDNQMEMFMRNESEALFNGHLFGKECYKVQIRKVDRVL